MSILSQTHLLIKTITKTITGREKKAPKPLDIILYNGYGNKNTFFVSGMVIVQSKTEAKNRKSSKWHNLRAMIKRFKRTTVPDIEVVITLQGVSNKTKTDDSGYFSCQLIIPFPEALKEERWITVKASLPNEKVLQEGDIQIISTNDKRIFVSDIDDTILISHSTKVLRKLRLILFKNAESRLPVPDIPLFYNQLKTGNAEHQDHPFFYVSSSEWNLYDLLDDFFRHHNIPKGTLLLKTYSVGLIKLWLSGKKNHDQKYDKIKFLLTFFPDQKFVLLGDNGQEDPFIYGKLSKEFPGRIETSYIRQIKNIRDLEPDKLSTLFHTNTQVVPIKDTSEAIAHARKIGYI